MEQLSHEDPDLPLESKAPIRPGSSESHRPEDRDRARGDDAAIPNPHSLRHRLFFRSLRRFNLATGLDK
jgi:hypothetical protein